MGKSGSVGATEVAHGNLLDAALMASALERRFQEHVDTFQSRLRVDKPRRKRKDIRIIVRTGQAGQFRQPAQSRTDALMLVQRHRNAVTAATDGNAAAALATLNRLGTGMREVRIIATIRRKSAEIHEFQAQVAQMRLDDALQFKTGMVAAHAYGKNLSHNSKKIKSNYQ